MKQCLHCNNQFEQIIGTITCPWCNQPVGDNTPTIPVQQQFAPPPPQNTNYGYPPYNPYTNPYPQNPQSIPPAAPLSDPAILPTTPSTQPQSQKPKKIGLIIVSIIVVILTISSLVSLYAVQKKKDDERKVAATATTAVKNQLTTATAVVAATATATNSTPYTPGEATKLVLSDSLTKPDTWDNQEFEKGSCTFANDTYRAKEPSIQNIFAICLSNKTSSNYRDFVIEVQMQITQGDCGGIIFRNNLSDQGYLALLCTHGTVGFKTYNPTNGTKTIQVDSIPQSGSDVTLAVVAKDDHFQLFINKQQALSIYDRTYSQGGNIGFLAFPLDAATEVAYKNVRVWTFA